MRNKRVFLVLLLFVGPVLFQNCGCEELDPGEIDLTFDDDTIPVITTDEWACINFTLKDTNGVDWISFWEDPQGIYAFRPATFFRIKIWWPMPFIMGRDIIRYLGYHSFNIDATIEAENPQGWYAKVYPSSINKTTAGFVHNLSLYVQTTNLAVDYDVVLNLTITRNDVYGEPSGRTIAYIPLKAATGSFTLLDSGEGTYSTSPKTIKKIPFSITHKGSYPTTYHLFSNHQNGLYVQLSDQYITLEAGESKTAYITVMTPEKLYDPGTYYPLKVIATSDDGSMVKTTDFLIFTQGSYLSQLTITLLVLSLLLLFIGLLVLKKLITYLKAKKRRKKEMRKEMIIERINKSGGKNHNRLQNIRRRKTSQGFQIKTINSLENIQKHQNQKLKN